MPVLARALPRSSVAVGGRPSLPSWPAPWAPIFAVLPTAYCCTLATGLDKAEFTIAVPEMSVKVRIVEAVYVLLFRPAVILSETGPVRSFGSS